MRWFNSTKAFLILWGVLLFATLSVIAVMVDTTLRNQPVRNSLTAPLPTGGTLVPPSPTPRFSPVPATLDTILQADHTWTATLAGQPTTRLVVTGDVLLAREVNYQMHQRQNYRWPFERTADFLRQADITLINLETPLIPDCPPMRDRMVFCGDPQTVEGLQWSGVDVASVANNHALNQGTNGVEQTVQLLQSKGIQVTGLPQQPTLIKHGETTFAFLGYTDVGPTNGKIAAAEPATIQADIRQAKQIADVVIPFFHWGEEYTYQPTLRQQELAHAAIDAGADMVIGNHPHWYQKVETYQGKIIMYSHGNFVFDQMWSTETRQGLVGQYTFVGSTLVDAEFFPIMIEDYGQPHFLSGADKAAIWQHFKQISTDGQ